MIADKRKSLQTILESEGGLHVSIYLPKTDDLALLKAHLHQCLGEARLWIYEVLCPEEADRFLEPLTSLLLDGRILKNMSGNVGLFRNAKGFRMVALPVQVEPSCVVATSFHVKPLLRWMQSDPTFLLIGIEDQVAHLYTGTQNHLQKTDSFNLSAGSPAWAAHFLHALMAGHQPRIFMAGDPAMTAQLVSELHRLGHSVSWVSDSFDEQNLTKIAAQVRRLSRIDVYRAMNEALVEYNFAEEMNLTRKNIFEIAKLVCLGAVKKLIVAEEIQVFGKIDKSTGRIQIHPFDLDHEDDDILDDLAQEVLAQGGEVLILPKEKLPKQRPALAILKSMSNDEVMKGAEA